MSDKTGIEWTDATWNPIAGCSLKSPGCTNCYAMKFAHRLLDKPGSHYEGTTKVVNGVPVWTGKIAVAPEHILVQPLLWKTPKKIFVDSMGDIFHEDVTDETIARIWWIMGQCAGLLDPSRKRGHIFQILTKRSDRMRKWVAGWCDPDTRKKWIENLYAPGHGEIFDWMSGPKYWPDVLPNVWLGVSLEDQKRADERIPDLLATPAAVRFISCEPLLGAVDLESAWFGESALDPECWGECQWCIKGRPALHNCQRGAGNDKDKSGIDWVIVGGESGPDARPMHPDWLISIRDQCQHASVPFFFKQWGEWFGVDAPESFDAKTEWIGWNDRKFKGDKLHDFGDGVVALRAGKKFLGNRLMGRKYEEFPA